MTEAKLYAEWKYPDERPDESGFGLSHKKEREAFICGYNKAIECTWKPSEEQMEELNKARRFIPYNCDILESLYEQLKKL